jgi:hypothetical protein
MIEGEGPMPTKVIKEGEEEMKEDLQEEEQKRQY